MPKEGLTNILASCHPERKTQLTFTEDTLSWMVCLGLYKCTRNKQWAWSELWKEAVDLPQAEHMDKEKTPWRRSTWWVPANRMACGRL